MSSEQIDRRSFLGKAAATGLLALGGAVGYNLVQSRPDQTVETDVYSEPSPVNDAGNNSSENSPEPEEPPVPYFRADLKAANQENAGMQMFQYSTDRDWDDLQVDLEKLEEWHNNDYTNPRFKDRWKHAKPFHEVITEDEVILEEPNGYVYSNYKEVDDPSGKWEFEEWKNKSFEDSLDDIAIAWYNYAVQRIGRIGSDQANIAPLNVEKAYETHRDEDVHGWGIHTHVLSGGRHGQSFIVNWDTNNLYVFDPAPRSSQTISTPENSTYNPKNFEESHGTEDVWHPLFRYDGTNPDNRLSYEDVKGVTEGMLVNMVTQDRELLLLAGAERGEGETAVTDEYLLGALDIMKEGKMPHKIYDQVKVIQRHALTPEQSQDMVLYGTIDDPRYAIGNGDNNNSEWDSLIQGINRSEETYTLEDVERVLDNA